MHRTLKAGCAVYPSRLRGFFLSGLTNLSSRPTRMEPTQLVYKTPDMLETTQSSRFKTDL